MADGSAVKPQQQGLPLGREIVLERCEELEPLRLVVDKVIGQGSFAVVYLAHSPIDNKKYAIKRLFQDKRYKNRELTILRMLDHPNCVKIKQFFITMTSVVSGIQYMNIVTPYYPESLASIMRYYAAAQEYMPLMYVRCFTYQLCSALAYIHSQNVVHRDVKPQNILLDMETAVLTLIDFGSAKFVKQGEASVSYICSRFYRAPELLLGASTYGTQIDTWAVGCIVAEMILGHPLFCGESTVDVLCEIFGLLGTPSREEMKAMNTPITSLDGLPILKPIPWRSIFLAHPPDDAIDFVSSLLRFKPESRMTAKECLSHKFLSKLKAGSLPGGIPMPPLEKFKT